jgi:hypothetical protein
LGRVDQKNLPEDVFLGSSFKSAKIHQAIFTIITTGNVPQNSPSKWTLSSRVFFSLFFWDLVILKKLRVFFQTLAKKLI